MGRTIPSYRIMLERELERWKRFQDFLRIDERAIFQDMMDECRRHASAAGAACFPVIAEAMYLTILFAHHKALKELCDKIDQINGGLSPISKYSSAAASHTMEPKEIVSKIFSADKSIRYVGIVGPGPEYKVLESRMKEGVKSLTADKNDREFVQIIPEIMLGAAEKLEKDLGKIEYALVRYKKLTLAFFTSYGYTVTISVEPGIPILGVYERIKAFGLD